MKRLLALVSVIVLFVPQLFQAQDLEKAKLFFENGEFEKADSVAKKLSSPDAQYLRAQSLFSLTRYSEALYLSETLANSESEFADDAQLLKSLCFIQTGEYDDAITNLFELKNASENMISLKAQRIYNQLLGFLTPGEQRSLLHSIGNPEIHLDLISAGLFAYGLENAPYLVQALYHLSDNSSVLQERIEELSAEVESDSTLFGFGRGLTVPEGFAYTIAIAMPVFDENSDVFDVTRGLYNGMLLAIEERNTSAPIKAFTVFVNTNDGRSQAEIFSEMMTEYHPHVIVGPLFSSNASQWAELAEEFQIPVILPLANTDSLAIANPYVFQVNPSFINRGKALARFALDQGMDTLSVIVERNSLGMNEALGFVPEFQKLGGNITYSFIEDLQEQQYNVNEYTKFFTTDSLLVDSLGYAYTEAVYLPVSGAIAPYLADLYLTDFEALRADIKILGSEEWSTTNISPERLEKFDIYYTRAFSEPDSARRSMFDLKYQERYDYAPNLYSYAGYDMGAFLSKTLDKAINPSRLHQVILSTADFSGLSLRISFLRSNANTESAVYYLKGETEQRLK